MPTALSDITVKIDTGDLVARLREQMGPIEQYLGSREAGDVLTMAMPVSRFYAIDPVMAFAYEAIMNRLSIAEMEELRIKAEERAAQARSERGSRGGADYEVRDGNAIVPVIGVMTKRPHCLADFFGGSASTLIAERQLVSAMRDDDVKDISIYIESPGGDVAGAFDLANTIWKVRKKKPVYAYLADQATSAGYLIAAQANRVFGNDNVISGSMGVYTTLVDTSMANAQRGVKVHLVKAGRYKGIGVNGVPISTEDLATVQQRIDAFHQLFIKAVNRGRMLTDKELEKVRDAQVYVGSQGVSVGLVDEIASFEDAVEMGRSNKGRVRTKGKPMPVGTGSSAADAATEQANDDNIQIDEVTALTTAIVAGTDDNSNTTASAGEIDWPSVAASLGIANPQAATQESIKLVVANGIKYDSMIRDAAKKMSIAAGYGNMDAHIDSLPIDKALTHLQDSEKVYRTRYPDGGRKSLPTDNGIAANSGTSNGGTPVAAGDKRPAAEIVADTKAQLRARGGHSVM